jgi:uncharacterized protein (TIGR02302 family)
MAPRTRGIRIPSKTDKIGAPQLILARIIVTAEDLVSTFAKPLLFAGFFVALSWLNFFTGLYPWAHLVALVIFTILFFHALGEARLGWKRHVPFSIARRRVELASRLSHRPFDTLDDRSIMRDAASLALWQAHQARARAQLINLHWPRWMLSFADRDPYALRYAVTILIFVGAITGWGALGSRFIAAINPELGRLHLAQPVLDAWITPPEYTNMAPIMIATPAGLRHDGDVIDIPEGSTVSAHVTEADGAAPRLIINGETVGFAIDDHGDYQASGTLHQGETISVRRGWQELGEWKIHVVPPTPPQVGFAEPPSVTEQKSVRLSYDVKDQYGVASVTAVITPRESLPGASDQPMEIKLSTPLAKEAKRVDFEDLTANPFAGLPVDIKLVATNAAGQKAESAVENFVLPERPFLNPVARALVNERKKLLQSPYDDTARAEAANVMAGVAQEPRSYHGDPVVLMALRSGAVRLVLNRGHDVISPVSDVLWQSAVRIEDGAIGMAEQNLRQAQKDLADALDRNASEEEVQKLIDRLHQALAQYLSELATRMAARPGPVENLGQLLGARTNMLTPGDLEKMLNDMRSKSASGARDEARAELAKLQQMLENLRTGSTELSEAQKAEIKNLQDLHNIVKDQQSLLDDTFKDGQSGTHANAAKLSTQQKGLLDRLKGIMSGMKGGAPDNFNRGADAMQGAQGKLSAGASGDAVAYQNEALKALQEAEQQMADDLRSGLMIMPSPEMAGAAGQDPLGRDFMGPPRDDGSVRLPEQMKTRRVREILDELQRRAGDMGRPKPERDYIERLLQNF